MLFHGAVVFRFGVQQKHGFDSRGLQHVSRSHALAQGSGRHQLCAHRVGGFAQIADGATRVLSNELR